LWTWCGWVFTFWFTGSDIGQAISQPQAATQTIALAGVMQAAPTRATSGRSHQKKPHSAAFFLDLPLFLFACWNTGGLYVSQFPGNQNA
jgi:hypothetical protein